MTIPNQITLARLLCIPFFVYCAATYSRGVAQGDAEPAWRIAALVIFALASISDGLDGWIARRFNQSSKLGRALDPVADKLLLLAGVVTLAATGWRPGLPVWFATLVISRDILIVTAVIVLHYRVGKVAMRPILSSKICTFLQLACVCWVLLDFWSVDGRPWPLDVLIWIAAGFTVFSGWRYAIEGIRQVKLARSTAPGSHVP